MEYGSQETSSFTVMMKKSTAEVVIKSLSDSVTNSHLLNITLWGI